ncbi:MAG: DUF4422 domain-containing protein [archaeon]|nr:DUF4422 domain-containing protein [archaeon]
MNSKKIFVMVAYHKPHSTLKTISHLFNPIHAGKLNSNIDLKILGDDTGKNISHKNPNYSELTAVYWMWKNIDADYYGIMHYRRYFIEPQNKIIEKFKNAYLNLRRTLNLNVNYNFQINKKLSKINMFHKKIALVEDYDIIIPKKWYFGKTVRKQYEFSHRKEDWKKLTQIMKKQPLYYKYFKQMENNNWIYPYNMGIFSKEIFNTYMNWLFKNLNKLETNITISKDPYQQRVFAFISERLFTTYMLYLMYEKPKIKIKEMPVMFIDE